MLPTQRFESLYHVNEDCTFKGMDELMPPLLPRCSTVLENSFPESSTSSHGSKSSPLESSLVGNLSHLSKAIESLNLAAISPIKTTSHLNLPWTEDRGLTDSDYRSASSKSLDVGFGSSEEESPEKSREICVSAHRDAETAECSDLAETPVEPEAEIIEQFRKFGVRFIRQPDRYVGCECDIPQQLIEWSLLMNEVTMSFVDPLPLCYHYRWAEIPQDFTLDVFGDLQFQDFLLARESRGPYHAMIHFVGTFANVGYDGSYWYWVLVGDLETPFIESKHKRKGTFIESLRTMIKEQIRIRKYNDEICPQPKSHAHLYVRGDETPFQREPQDTPKIQVSLWPSNEHEDVLEHLDRDSLHEKQPQMINGQIAPKGLSYLQLYCDNYRDTLSNI